MENKILRITLPGGLIGLLFSNPRRALEKAIQEHNQQGYRCTYFTANFTPNLLVTALQMIVLVCTLGLWTWGSGYLLLLEKSK